MRKQRHREDAAGESVPLPHRRSRSEHSPERRQSAAGKSAVRHADCGAPNSGGTADKELFALSVKTMRSGRFLSLYAKMKRS